MPRRGRKKILGKRPDIEQEKRADELQNLERELHRKQSRRRRREGSAEAPERDERSNLEDER
ncbi:hypothetical protein [Allorhizocola rhizosphaerae]|uniref:hypothetical protein n=1 Tax=Allorhizocola rhizosphaerae TaxID=1872709 RepID=UPI000E3D4037|nr:hypothetical protein [Allorhizocola rhizosphaerae]